jgi:hypothetical protein
MELPEHLHARANELLTMEQEGADRRRDWVVVLGLKPTLDGNMWCFLWGDDLQSGVAGFGDTVYAAMMDFDRAMYRNANAHADLSAASADKVRRVVGKSGGEQ